jgi:glycosyltransferase involved in cell wall biosynthesis
MIFVASNQCALLDRLTRRPKTFVIPHGVDVEFFQPAPARPLESPHCLFVGSWLRDFAALEQVVLLVSQARPDVVFRLVLPSDRAAVWKGRTNVHVLTGIDDVMLRECYREAALLVMPLQDCTANNSLLEGMACGVPIVATDVGGVREYVDSSCARLIPPGNPAAMAETVLDLLSRPELRNVMARAARARAEEFAWPRVAEQVLQAYRVIV